MNAGLIAKKVTMSSMKKTACMLLMVACVPVCVSAQQHADESARAEMYSADGRIPVKKFYEALNNLADKGLWDIETVYVDKTLPIYVLHTKQKSPAIWLLAGIHGEEPAPPNAVYKNIGKFNALAAKKIPVVLFPLCNPAGYSRNWRYPDAEKYSEQNPGYSVGDSDHLLPDKDGKPRIPKASSAQADALTRKVLALAKDYPPALSIDLHEDNLLEKGYIYSQGPGGREDKAAKNIIKRMTGLNYPIMLSGKTRFNEPIINGIVSDVKDGSIDELIASERIIVNGTLQAGPSGKSVIVVETSAAKMPLKERVRVHSSIIGMLEDLYKSARK